MGRFSQAKAALRGPTLISIALSGGSAAVAGVTSLLAARWMGADERGLYALLIAGSGFLLLLCSLGVVNTANVLIADPQQNLSVRRFFGLADRFVGLAALVLVPASATVLLVYAEAPTGPLFLVFATYCLLSLLAAFYRAGLHGWSRHRLAFGIEVVAGTFLLIGAFAVHQNGHLSVFALVALGTLAFLGQALIARVAIRRAPRGSEDASGMSLAGLCKASLPTLGYSVGGWIASRGDRLVLGLVSDNAQVGIYSTVATMAEVPWLVAATLGTVLSTRLAATRDVSLVGRFRLRAVAGCAAVWILMTPASWWLLVSFLGGEFRTGVPALLLMGPAAFLLASSQIDLAACLALGDRVSPGRVSLVGAAVMVLTSAVLGSLFGATGCAIASVITYAVMALLGHQASKRNLARLRLAATVPVKGQEND